MTKNSQRPLSITLSELESHLWETVANFKEALAKCREAEEHLRKVMHEGGWLK